MLVGTFASLAVIDVSAVALKTTEKDDELGYTISQSGNTFKNPQEKLATMKLMLEKDGYQLWVHESTGEVATVKMSTGEILFSNPYNLSDSTAKTSIKAQILSQIFVRYTDNDTEKTFYSYTEAACRNQIKVKNIKNGVRIEYTMGREETRMLVPRMIRKDRFEEQILNVMLAEIGESFEYKQFKAYFVLKDTSVLTSDRQITELEAAFPITKKMAVYVFDPTASQNEIARAEEKIKTYCPLYTYEQLDYDHELTEYTGSDRAPANFKMALEYSLDEYGMSVRLPANGIRFNASEYSLTYISILPYMGAGSNPNTGYNMFPDGSGTLFRFEDLDTGTTTTVNSKVYGADYAYHTITGTHQEIVRYPVFGIVENQSLKKTVNTDTIRTPEVLNADGTVKTPAVYVTETVAYEEDRGFVAIIEEGDALAELSDYHAGTQSEYNTIQMLFYPRPKDTYNLKDAISVGANTTWTVTSARKYVGNYKIRYIMLTDDEVAEEKGVTDYYECSYMGMADACRDYWEDKGILKRLTDADIEEDIPLYIETFGALETVEKILSVPVNVMTPLTSFDNIKTMYEEFKAQGVTNINFKLTGYANGGMYASIPYRLRWEKAVGGKNGFQELVDYAKEEGFGIYPDFDFVYTYGFTSGWLDGFVRKNHAVKTIDNRYTSKRTYSATYQTYISNFALAVSPAYFSRFYEKLTDKYLEYSPMGISVATLGSELNSDFDEDEPYNREDSKEFTIKAFQFLNESYDSIMTSSGNQYSWTYADHLLGMPLDSSRYIKSSNSIPFLGAILHGYTQFSGTPLNMEGDIGYALLKAVENGASIYFTLSYQNTAKLKEDMVLSDYFSIRYDIWKDDVVYYYNYLNSLLQDVQTKLIIDHKFLIGERIPDVDELEADLKAELDALNQQLSNADAVAEAARRKALYEARTTIEKDAQTAIESYAEVVANAKAVLDLVKEFDTCITTLKAAKAAADAAPTDAALATAYTDAMKAAETKMNDILNAAVTKKAYEDRANEAHELVKASADLIEGAHDASAEVKAAAADVLKSVEDAQNADKITVNQSNTMLNASKNKADANGIAYIEPEELIIPEEPEEPVISDDEEETEETEEETEEEIRNIEEVEEYNYTKYTDDTGSIVAVTYGGKNGNDNDPFKTFVLNYNSFAVEVVFEGTTYTIPAFSLVVIYR
ncbi:MAG: hypothetical protein IJW99_07990 [Clostridia bacterium]|nr:hypothetical protein [Clostridia bacterium]